MTKTKRTRLTRLAKIGGRVQVLAKAATSDYPAGTVGVVVDHLAGACGPILAVRFPHLPNRTVDLFWRKVRPL